MNLIFKFLLLLSCLLFFSCARVIPLNTLNKKDQKLVIEKRKRKKSKCRHNEKEFKCVEYLYNYDGDTVTFNIPKTHKLFGYKIPIRLGGLDTPERRGKTPCEKDLSLIVKNFVTSKLKYAKSIKLNNLDRGKYFRIVADIIYDGKNLKNEILKNHLAVTYNGGHKFKVDWCKKMKLYKAL